MKDRFQKLIEHLNAGLYERQEAVKLALLAAISGESIFFLGPPGVAKSLIARRLSKIFESGKSFEYLMNRFSTPEEIFGPISVSKLKNEDKYERVIDKYLPSADIAFLDEIWKAGPSIQNTLLTIINEKIFRNGQQQIKVPLKCLVAASNELPAKGEGLEALWDRFLIRYIVTNISNPLNFAYFLQSDINDNEFDIPKELKISEREYNNWQKSISAIELPEEVIDIINIVRYNISEYNKNAENPIYVSDRRWKKIVKVLKTSAFINGRNYVDLSDLFLVVYMIWSEVEHIDIVKEMIIRIIKNHGYLTVSRKIEKSIETLSKTLEEKTIITNQREIIIPKLYNVNDRNMWKKIRFNKSYFINSTKFINYYNKMKNENNTFYKIVDNSNYLSGFRFILTREIEIDNCLIGQIKAVKLYEDFPYGKININIECLSNYRVTIYKPNSYYDRRYINFKQDFKDFKLETQKIIINEQETRDLNQHEKQVFKTQIDYINKIIDKNIKKYQAINKTFNPNLFFPDSLNNLCKLNIPKAIENFNSSLSKLKKIEKSYE